MDIVLLVIWVLISFVFGFICGKKSIVNLFANMSDSEWAIFVLTIDSARKRVQESRGKDA